MTTYFTRSVWRVGLVCAAALLLIVSSAPAAEILFIGGAGPDPTSGDDGFVFDFLEDLGHDVTYLQASASTRADGEEVDLIILSSTPDSPDMRGKFVDLETPILNWEEALMDGNTAAGNFAMGQGSENGTASPGTEIQILDPTHPLAAGLSGTVEFAFVPIPNPHITGTLAPDVTAVAGFPEPPGDIELSPSGDGMHMGSNNGGGNAFTGLLDEMAIWDRSLSFVVDGNQNLTGGEVHTVYTQGVAAVSNANPGPIGYWPFEDQNDDTLAVDESDGGFDGFLEGGAFLETGDTPAGAGGTGALLLDGTGTVDVDVMERPGGELTYAFWFNPDSVEYGAEFLATEDDRVDFFYGNGVGGTVRPHLSANRGARPVGLYVNADGDLATPIEAATESFSTDEWHHVLITWDGDIGSVFVDGKLDNQIRLVEAATQYTITVVEEGGELQDGTEAAGPRVNFPIQDTGFDSLTDDGLLLFTTAVNWLLEGGTPQVPGDYNNNGELDLEDLNLQAVAIEGGDNPLDFDLTGDNLVDYADRLAWVNDLKNTWIGDSNLDLKFDSGDMVQVFVAGKYEKAEIAGWEEGDWNADRKFDSADMVAAFVAGGYEKGEKDPPAAAVSAVPEPTGLLLLSLGLLGLATRRRRS